LRALSLVFTRFAGFTPVLFLLCQPFVSKDESLVNKDEFRQQYQLWGVRGANRRISCHAFKLLVEADAATQRGGDMERL
ncbi:MAG TPA: hypothetical protein V6D11_00600, partial [Waterburya sp.]